MSSKPELSNVSRDGASFIDNNKAPVWYNGTSESRRERLRKGTRIDSAIVAIAHQGKTWVIYLASGQRLRASLAMLRYHRQPEVGWIVRHEAALSKYDDILGVYFPLTRAFRIAPPDRIDYKYL